MSRHVCSSIMASDNGSVSVQHQAIIWTNAGSLSIWPLETKFSEVWIKIKQFSYKKLHLKMSSAKWQPFCHGLDVLTHYPVVISYTGQQCLRKWLVAWQHQAITTWINIDEIIVVTVQFHTKHARYADKHNHSKIHVYRFFYIYHRPMS